MKALPYIVLAMIAYDFSIHLIYLLGKQDFFLKRNLNYWPERISKKRYQQFWTTFWGTAVVLLLAHLVNG